MEYSLLQNIHLGLRLGFLITMIVSPYFWCFLWFEISNVMMMCISYYPTFWLMFIYLYFMILHVGKDTTHRQYCVTASWHWQMTNPPTSLQKIMYTKCTIVCKDWSTNQKTNSWNHQPIPWISHPMGNGFIPRYNGHSTRRKTGCWSVGFKFTSNGPNLHRWCL